VSAGADEHARAGIIAALESDTAGQVKGVKDQLENIRKRLGIRGGVTAPDKAAGQQGSASPAPANTNAKGWELHTDKNGAKAYVSPDGKQFEEVK
jgi:hypothetical protein